MSHIERMSYFKFSTVLAASFFLVACSQSNAVKSPILEGDVSETAKSVETKSVILAGGCFWCVESDFDKVEGVVSTTSGYSGGHLDNPTYKQVSKENTGHYEVVRIEYDPHIVSFDELITYYWRHVDPTDGGGQFCDRGDSYRTAIFVNNEEERDIAETSKKEVTDSEVLDDPIVTPILSASTFWPAENYHQDYYQKNPIRYKYYRTSCGRDKSVKQVWKKELSAK